MDKQLIAKRFSRARDTYSHEARVQQQVADKMMQLLQTHTPTGTFRHVVEFGCGTGSYSRVLKQSLRLDTLLLNDLCGEMRESLTDILSATQTTEVQTTNPTPPAVATQNGRITFLADDAEYAEFPNGSDLITSCSTLQWFNSPEHFFKRCHRFLAPEGYLAFSTFGMENMYEIRSLTGHGLRYLSLEKLSSLLHPLFEVIYREEEIVRLTFDNPLQVLQHLKQTGVTGTEKTVWTRGRLQTFCEEYTRLFAVSHEKVSLTYHPIYIIARKRNIPATIRRNHPETKRFIKTYMK